MQFKKLLDEIRKEQKDRDETTKKMPMVDTIVEFKQINGLTAEENRELQGVLNPSETIHMSTRSQFLKIQADHIKKKL